MKVLIVGGGGRENRNKVQKKDAGMEFARIFCIKGTKK